MTTKTRKEIETILTGAAVAARKVTKLGMTGAYGMDSPDTIYFVATGADETSITPAQLGRAIERVGASLQGRSPADADISMVNRAASGNTEPLDVHKPFGPHSEDAAAVIDDSDGSDGSITGAQIVALLKLSEQTGRHLGRAVAYKDVLETAEKRLHQHEEALKRAIAGGTEEAMCMGEIMALRCLLDAFDGAIDHFTKEGAETMARLGRFVVDQGLTGVENAAREAADKEDRPD